MSTGFVFEWSTDHTPSRTPTVMTDKSHTSQEALHTFLDTDIEQSSSHTPSVREGINASKSASLPLEQEDVTRPSIPPGPPGGWLAQQMSPMHEIAFNFMVSMVQLIPQACLTTCFPIINVIVASLGVKQLSTMPWVVAAYSISFGTTILLAGRLGDIFGHKQMVIIGFCWLSIFSTLAGLSHHVGYELFFVARALQGIGAAMMNPNALALLGRSYPPGSKGKILAFSAFALCAPLGAYFGMLASALFAQYLKWYWSFYTTAFVCAVLAPGSYFILPNPIKSPKQRLPFRQKIGQMDWLGGLTGVTGLVAVQVALICAPSQQWSTQYIFMLFIIGVLLITFFIIIELKIATEPLVPFKLLTADNAFVLAIMACGWGTFGTWTYYLWRFFLSIWRLRPVTAAFYALPIVPVALIAAALTAYLMRRVRPPWILFWALLAFMLGPLFLVFSEPATPYWNLMFVSLLVMPFGMDMSFPSATFVMSNSLPMDKQGIAGSLVTTVVNYSIALGLGFAATVEVHVNDHGRNPLKGFKGGWYFGIGLGCLGMLISAVFIAKTSAGLPSVTLWRKKAAIEPDHVNAADTEIATKQMVTDVHELANVEMSDESNTLAPPSIAVTSPKR